MKSKQALLEIRFVLNVPPCYEDGDFGRYVESPNAHVSLLVLRNVFCEDPRDENYGRNAWIL